MKYIALLRGINVGGNRRVEMKKLKLIFEAMGCQHVSTYINSGNVIFESDKQQTDIRKKIEANLKKEFGLEILTLVKTEREMKKIATAIPADWQNDARQRTDVAYLFEKSDSKEILSQLPLNREFIEVRYVPGAIFWNLDRQNYSKCRLNKLISHGIYQFMTVRNVNTARFLAGIK
jgi:uncharacterized protein (DUF1697 family)